MPRPRLKVYSKNLSPEGRLQAYLSRPDGAGASLDACVLHSGKIRLDIYEDKERTPCSVRVNIREEQSFHAAMILMPSEVNVLKAVQEHRPSMAEVAIWDLDTLLKLNKMGLIDGKVSATNTLFEADGTKHETYDCRMMEITAAGQYILDRAKERGDV